MKLAVVIDSGFMPSLKLALTREFRATAMAFAAGTVELTVGAVVSGAVPVLKVQVCAALMKLPATSRTAVVMLAVQSVAAGKTIDGLKVAI